MALGNIQSLSMFCRHIKRKCISVVKKFNSDYRKELLTIYLTLVLSACNNFSFFLVVKIPDSVFGMNCS